MSIIYTEHLKLRLNQRKIPFDFPKMILLFPDQEYFDSVEHSYVAIKRLPLVERSQQFAVAYNIDIKNDKIAMTIHPINQKQIDSKLISKRWI